MNVYLEGVNRSKHFFFLKKVRLGIKLKGNTCKTFCQENVDLMHTPDLFGLVKRTIYFD